MVANKMNTKMNKDVWKKTFLESVELQQKYEQMMFYYYFNKPYFSVQVRKWNQGELGGSMPSFSLFQKMEQNPFFQRALKSFKSKPFFEKGDMVILRKSFERNRQNGFHTELSNYKYRSSNSSGFALVHKRELKIDSLLRKINNELEESYSVPLISRGFIPEGGIVYMYIGEVEAFFPINGYEGSKNCVIKTFLVHPNFSSIIDTSYQKKIVSEGKIYVVEQRYLKPF